MRKLVFANNPEFYNHLTHAITTGEKVEILTNYTRFCDLPKQLLQIFELPKYKTEKWVNSQTATFIPKSISSVGLSPTYLSGVIIAGSTTAGEIFGGVFLGSLGVILGRAIGLTAGVLSVLLKNEQYEASVIVAPSGQLTICFEPS